jgi:hypothetical protein
MKKQIKTFPANNYLKNNSLKEHMHFWKIWWAVYYAVWTSHVVHQIEYQGFKI